MLEHNAAVSMSPGKVVEGGLTRAQGSKEIVQPNQIWRQAECSGILLLSAGQFAVDRFGHQVGAASSSKR